MKGAYYEAPHYAVVYSLIYSNLHENPKYEGTTELL